MRSLWGTCKWLAVIALAMQLTSLSQGRAAVIDSLDSPISLSFPLQAIPTSGTVFYRVVSQASGSTAWTTGSSTFLAGEFNSSTMGSSISLNSGSYRPNAAVYSIPLEEFTNTTLAPAAFAGKVQRQVLPGVFQDIGYFSLSHVEHAISLTTFQMNATVGFDSVSPDFVDTLKEITFSAPITTGNLSGGINSNTFTFGVDFDLDLSPGLIIHGFRSMADEDEEEDDALILAGQFQVSVTYAVPEPAACSLAGSGLALLVAAGLRKRKRV